MVSFFFDERKIVGFVDCVVVMRDMLPLLSLILFSNLLKILPRISVGGISVVCVVVVVVVCRAVVDGSLDLSARATSFFI
jgi:hypothetical protein